MSSFSPITSLASFVHKRLKAGCAKEALKSVVTCAQFAMAISKWERLTTQLRRFAYIQRPLDPHEDPLSALPEVRLGPLEFHEKSMETPEVFTEPPGGHTLERCGIQPS